MSNRSRRRALAIAGAVVFALPCLAEVGPRCTRVQPDLEFPQPAWLAEQRVEFHSLFDVDGDGVLELVVLRRVESPAGYDVAFVSADGAGGLRAETVAHFDGPDPWWDFYPWATLDARDVDGDGLTDLTVLWHGFMLSSLLQLRRGLAGGGYGPVEETPATLQSWLVGAGDFDGDRLPELLTGATWYWPPYEYVSRYLAGAGAGWQYTGSIEHAGGTPWIGDVDRDGDDDVLVAVYPGLPQVLFGDPGSPLGAQAWPILSPVNALPSSMLLVGARDGGHDLVTFEPDPERPGALELSCRRLTPDLVFEEFWRQDLDPGIHAPQATMDIDHDGDLDLLRGTTSTDWLQVLLAGPAGFTPGPEDRRTTDFVGTIDTNHDGWLDAISVRDGALAIQRGEPGLRFHSGEIAHESGDGEAERYPALGDLDEDGTLDLLVRLSGEPVFDVRRGAGDGSFHSIGALPALGQPWKLLDIDGDGHLDIAKLSAVTGPGLSIAYGRGDGSFEPWRGELPDGRCTDVVRADLDADGTSELLVSAIAVGQRVTLAAYAIDGRVLVPLDSFVADCPDYTFPIATGHVGGVPGIAVVYPVRGPAGGSADARAIRWRSWLRGEGFSEERVLVDDVFTSVVYALDLADLDGDGRDDLLVRSEVPYWHSDPEVRVFRGADSAPYSLLWSGDDPALAYHSRLADLDGDGFLDLVGEASPFSVRRGDGTGRFVESSRPWIGTSRSGALADVRNRGVLELLDLERRGERWDYVNYSVVVPQLGEPLPADEAPPEIHFVIDPRAGAKWLVASAARDDCTLARIVSRDVALLAVPANAPLVLLPGPTVELTVLEDPATGLRRAALAGPDPRALRDLWAQFRARGVPIPQNHVLELVDEPAWGPSSDQLPGTRPIGNTLRVVQRITFLDGVPARAEVHHPGERLALRAVAEDQAGRRTEATAGLPSR
ncbi:MAG: VCBS repeat-containing protein [Acidobacteria bacterium]|nr:VCBS repeat-containing protein [Acidobacteriota bacterium]